MIINIIGGNGLMGQIHTPIFESEGHEIILSGRNSDTIKAAKESDITIISVPISSTKQVIAKIAPYCTAILDFTGVKVMPMKTMKKFLGKKTNSQNLEFAGLHPLYGKVSSIKGKTVVYCPSSKIGPKIREILNCFEKAGANIAKMSPEAHDREMAIVQVGRSLLLETFGTLLTKTKLDFEDLIKISPPPTKAIIELIARQNSDISKDNLYREMIRYNPYSKIIRKEIIRILSNPMYNPGEKIRKLFGTNLEKENKRADKLIDSLE